MDIDLAYLPLEIREDAIINVRAALERIAHSIEQVPGLSANFQDNKPDEMRIILHSGQAQIKIEVSPVTRETLNPPTERDVVESVENEFGFASIQVVSLADLYSSKLCAALDRNTRSKSRCFINCKASIPLPAGVTQQENFSRNSVRA